MPTRAELARLATEHLTQGDPVLRKVILQAGRFTLKPNRDRFGMLVGSIISQQISTKAATAIRGRVNALVESASPTAETLNQLGDAELRAAGLSPQKLGYLRDLCNAVLTNRVNLPQIHRHDDETVIEELIAIKGIGRWTAQMFLMFSLGRWDVFPHDDFGVRVALRDLYGLDDLPKKPEALRIAEPWRPYASVASWYCWRYLDLKKVASG